jgi:hypothetical protein
MGQNESIGAKLHSPSKLIQSTETKNQISLNDPSCIQVTDVLKNHVLNTSDLTSASGEIVAQDNYYENDK